MADDNIPIANMEQKKNALADMSLYEICDEGFQAKPCRLERRDTRSGNRHCMSDHIRRCENAESVL